MWFYCEDTLQICQICYMLVRLARVLFFILQHCSIYGAKKINDKSEACDVEDVNVRMYHDETGKINVIQFSEFHFCEIRHSKSWFNWIKTSTTHEKCSIHTAMMRISERISPDYIIQIMFPIQLAALIDSSWRISEIVTWRIQRTKYGMQDLKEASKNFFSIASTRDYFWKR